ncbi:MAG: hypothetical protein ACOX7B_06310 [Christensenellales bacterium]|jgi:hypothetical protein
MKKLFMAIMVLVLSVSVVAFAVDSPTLEIPPTVSNVSIKGASVKVAYNEQTASQAQALADAVKSGKSEIEFFSLSEEDMTEVIGAGFDLAALSVDGFYSLILDGYEGDPESISFTMTFPVSYTAGQKVLVLMGIGDPVSWTVQEAVVNDDGSLTITLNDFPAEPFLLCLLS